MIAEIFADIGRSILRGCVILLLVIAYFMFALGVLAAHEAWSDMVDMLDEGIQLEDVATPPPQPPPSATALGLSIITGNVFDAHDVDNFWGRSIPLLL